MQVLIDNLFGSTDKKEIKNVPNNNLMDEHAQQINNLFEMLEIKDGLSSQYETSI